MVANQYAAENNASAVAQSDTPLVIVSCAPLVVGYVRAVAAANDALRKVRRASIGYIRR